YPRLCCSSKLESLARYFMFGPSVQSNRPTMPSADFCNFFPSLLNDSSSKQSCRPPRVLRSHLHAYANRIYKQALLTGIGLRRQSHPHPACLPHMRFLFVGPALCLRLPSDSTSRETPLPSG